MEEEAGYPRIAHVAFNALDPEVMLNFYVQVLGLREVESSYKRRRSGLLNRFAGDGSTNLAIHPFFNSNVGHERRFGVNHIGFLVDDLARKLDDLGAWWRSRRVRRTGRTPSSASGTPRATPWTCPRTRLGGGHRQVGTGRLKNHSSNVHLLKNDYSRSFFRKRRTTWPSKSWI